MAWSFKSQKNGGVKKFPNPISQPVHVVRYGLGDGGRRHNLPRVEGVDGVIPSLAVLLLPTGTSYGVSLLGPVTKLESFSSLSKFSVVQRACSQVYLQSAHVFVHTYFSALLTMNYITDKTSKTTYFSVCGKCEWSTPDWDTLQRETKKDANQEV